jgi:hypothetical protein
VAANSKRTTLESSPPLRARSKCREAAKRDRRWASHHVGSEASHLQPPVGVVKVSNAAQTLGYGPAANDWSFF